MYTHVPTAFVPQEDQSYFLIIVQDASGGEPFVYGGVCGSSVGAGAEER